ncbi:oxidoreductase [Pseudonocardia nematodicida]|uniref:Oxidoreductase n=1 Tax=Pseudonocardia nematodicida TaxID=1206997 RepID=A0ABV1K700_9PSEU
MGLFDRFRSRRPAGGANPPDAETYLREWTAARIGVEAFVEPPTIVTETTVVFVAHDGEWTRRRVGSPKKAKKLARSMKMPIYDVQLVGYPQRMRDHDARGRAERKREKREEMLRQLREKDREQR